MGARLKITCEGPYKQKVELDGSDISNAIRGVELLMGVGEPTAVRLDLAVFEVETDACARIALTDRARDLLIEQGWQPPANENE